MYIWLGATKSHLCDNDHCGNSTDCSDGMDIKLTIRKNFTFWFKIVHSITFHFYNPLIVVHPCSSQGQRTRSSCHMEDCKQMWIANLKEQFSDCYLLVKNWSDDLCNVLSIERDKSCDRHLCVPNGDWRFVQNSNFEKSNGYFIFILFGTIFNDVLSRKAAFEIVSHWSSNGWDVKRLPTSFETIVTHSSPFTCFHSQIRKQIFTVFQKIAWSGNDCHGLHRVIWSLFTSNQIIHESNKLSFSRRWFRDSGRRTNLSKSHSTFMNAFPTLFLISMTYEVDQNKECYSCHSGPISWNQNQ
jgi:hypothetical protein